MPRQRKTHSYSFDLRTIDRIADFVNRHPSVNMSRLVERATVKMMDEVESKESRLAEKARKVEPRKVFMAGVSA